MTLAELITGALEETVEIPLVDPENLILERRA